MNVDAPREKEARAAESFPAAPSDGDGSNGCACVVRGEPCVMHAIDQYRNKISSSLSLPLSQAMPLIKIDESTFFRSSNLPNPYNIQIRLFYV